MCIVLLSHQLLDTSLSSWHVFRIAAAHLELAIKVFVSAVRNVVAFFCHYTLNLSVCHLFQYIYLSTGDISAAMHIFSLKGELVISHLSNNTQGKQKALLKRLEFAMVKI